MSENTKHFRSFYGFSILPHARILEVEFRCSNKKTILNKVVECSEAFWIFTLVDINE